MSVENDIFTVSLPWSLPSVGLVVNEFELEIVALQQHIIDSLQDKIERMGYSNYDVMKSSYEAMLQERDEILQRNDRFKEETNVMRRDRNFYLTEFNRVNDELEATKDKLAKSLDEIGVLEVELRHKTDELQGVPKLIENKVAAALSETALTTEQAQEYQSQIDSLTNQVDVTEQKRKVAASKNAELALRVGENASLMKEQEVFIEELSAVAGELLTAQRSSEIGLKDADQNYKSVLEHCEDLQGYLMLVCHENEQLKNDNLHMTLLKDYEELNPIFKKEGWVVYAFSKANCLFAKKGDKEYPNTDYAYYHAVNFHTADAHFIYLNDSDEVQIPSSVHDAIRIPKAFFPEIKEAIKAVPMAEIQDALGLSVDRASNIVKYARLLDVDWQKAVDGVEIAKQLNQYVPEEKLNKILNHIKIARDLIPRTQAKANRINKRFGVNINEQLAKIRLKPQDKPSGQKKSASKKRKRK